MKFKIGQKVHWKAAGKVSRLDGVSGQVVHGTIEAIDLDRGTLTIKKGYESIVPLASLELAQAIED